MAELKKLKGEGKIRAIGVSNASTIQMDEYGDIQADQEKFNMFQRKSESQGKLEYCKNKGIAFLAYSPLAQGLLTGKMKSGQTFPHSDVRNSNPLFSPENIKKVNLMLEDWKPLCEKHNADLGQIAAAWTFEYSGVTHVLLGTRSVEQALRNAKAGDIQLEQEDINIINTSYEKYF
jgi:aryl-alcohol dehydrogenase-like predicted oxidoreductase